MARADEAIARDARAPAADRRAAIRRLFEAGPRTGITLGELGARVAAEAWLTPASVVHVAVVIGKIPVAWTADDRVVNIDVLPGSDGHKLVVYLRVAGQPPVEDIAAGLRGERATDLVVQQIGFFEQTEAPGAPPPEVSPPPLALAGIVLCRRAICDADTGSHTLVDVLVDVPIVRAGELVRFDVYFQLRQLGGGVELAVEVLDDEHAVLTTGTLTLQRAAGGGAAAIGVAIPNLAVTFARLGVHRLRVRAGDEVLGVHEFAVTGGGVAA